MKFSSLFYSSFSFSLLFLSAAHFPLPAGDDYLLLDDFSDGWPDASGLWEGFTDQVMGGVSEIITVRLNEDGEFFVRMTGTVSLENRGGFIQIRRKISKERSSSGSDYQGVRLKIRGEGDAYYLFARTSRSILPWQYFSVPIPLTQEWRVIDLPWDDFIPGDYGTFGKFNPGKVKSIALTAFGEAFRAQVDLAEIGFYR